MSSESQSLSEANLDRRRSPSARGAAPGDVLVQVGELRTHFAIRRGLLGRVRGYVRAVDGVSFNVRRGGTLGLVGESGCGKTTLARTILRLIPASGGKVLFDGIDLFALRRRRLRRLRRWMQVIFQDPLGSLNPRLTLESIVGEGLSVHGMARGERRRDRVVELLERVGLGPADLHRLPHELSGGQRQRVGIARALATEPSFIVCDEPVSALDVSIQSQILNLLADLQSELGLSYLFISHDLAVVRHFAAEVAVMYFGRIVEIGKAAQIYTRPRHPYTQSLLMAVPRLRPRRRARRSFKRAMAPPLDRPLVTPRGCSFHTRCPFTIEPCRRSAPLLETKPDLRSEHRVACHRGEEPLDLTGALSG